MPTDNQVTVNGLTMGAGTSYEILSIDGLDMPPLRDTNVAKLQSEGEFPGPVKRQPRVIVVTLEIVGTVGSDLSSKIGAFLTAWNRTDTEVALTYKIPGTAVRRVTGRPWRANWSWTVRSDTSGVVPAVAEFRCSNPRILDDATSAEVLF